MMASFSSGYTRTTISESELGSMTTGARSSWMPSLLTWTVCWPGRDAIDPEGAVGPAPRLEIGAQHLYERPLDGRTPLGLGVEDDPAQRAGLRRAGSVILVVEPRELVEGWVLDPVRLLSRARMRRQERQASQEEKVLRPHLFPKPARAGFSLSRYALFPLEAGKNRRLYT